MSDDPAPVESFLDRVKDKLGEAALTVKKESQDGGRIDQAFDKLGDLKDVAVVKLGEAVETIKKESQEGGKIDLAKTKLADAFDEMKDSVASKISEVRGKAGPGEPAPKEPAADEPGA